MWYAENYCAKRANNLSKPCSWQKHYNEYLEADSFDLMFLHDASFLPDGITVIFADGTVAKKSPLSRRNPWIALH